MISPLQVNINEPEFFTLMLFRCTIRKYAEEFRKGYVYFGSPRLWIGIEEKGTKGQGDKLEGTCASLGPMTNEIHYRELSSLHGIHSFVDEGYCFFRRDDILDVPCLCLYGLHSTAFVKETLDDGRIRYTTSVSKKYFSDFTEYKSRESSKGVKESQRPVLLQINNVNEFFSRLVKGIELLGVKREDIIIASVDYINKHSEQLSMTEFPYELLQKDNYFKDQSEVRVIIKKPTKRFCDYLKKYGNRINIGSLDDITSISDYYYDDMQIYRYGNKSLMISLPQPKNLDIHKMNLSELCGLLENIVVHKTVSLIVPEDHKDASYTEQIKLLLDIFRDKYNIMVDISNGSINMFAFNDKPNSELDKLIMNSDKNALWRNNAELVLKENGARALLDICEKAFQNKDVRKVAYYYAGLANYKLKNLQTAMDCFSASYRMDYLPIDSLSSIASILCENKQYSDAIGIYRKIQECKGFDDRVFGNIGICYIHLGDYENAVDMFLKEIEMNPNDAYPYYNLGVAYYRMGQKTESKALMERAISIDANNEFYVKEYNKAFGLDRT